MGRLRVSRKSQKELPFDAWERIRELTRRRRDQLVESANFTPTLNRMLLALHARCGGKRICWPSNQVLARDLGYTWLDGREGETKEEKLFRKRANEKTRSVIYKQLAALKKAKALRVQATQRRDGSQGSNVYSICYGALRGCAPAEMVQRPRVTGAAPPCNHGSAPAEMVQRLECNRNEWKSMEAADADASCQLSVVSCQKKTGNEDGGGGVGDKNECRTSMPSPGVLTYSAARTKSQVARRGAWAPTIDRRTLNEPVERLRLIQAAQKAGLLGRDVISQVRFVAVLVMAEDKPSEHLGGFIVSILEDGAWHRLTGAAVSAAVGKVGCELSGEQLSLVRCP